jgi:K+-transporting ATPase ATPase C chain
MRPIEAVEVSTPFVRPAARQTWAAVRMLLVMTVLVGLAYPLLMTGFAQVVFPGKADGSMIRHDGRLVGSSLIGQSFTGQPQYFQSRPSAAGKGYDPLASGASNLGPENPALVEAVADRRSAAAELDGTDPADVAPDALLASGSGHDPDISPLYAAQQVDRVAKARGISPAKVRVLVAEHTQGRSLGFLGEAHVNVLELNLALDRLTS